MKARFLIFAVLFAVLAIGGFWRLNPAILSSQLPWSDNHEIPSTTANRRDLIRLLSVQGKLQCQIDAIRCPIKGTEIEIIEFVRHGAVVQPGDVVVEFDRSALQRRIKQKRGQINQLSMQVAELQHDHDIQVNKNRGTLSTAEYELKLAQLKLTKYIKSDFRIQQLALEGQIAEAKSKLERRRLELEKFRQLVKKGYRTSRQTDEISNLLKSSESKLREFKERLRTLVDFEFEQKQYELESIVEEAKSKLKLVTSEGQVALVNIKNRLQAAKTNHKSASNQLDELQNQVDQCVIRADRGGVIAHCLDEWRYRIQKGDKLVHNQNVFYYVNSQKMLVDFLVPVSAGGSLKKGMKGVVHVHGFAGEPFSATVSQVNKENVWILCKATIDEIPDSIELNPGMEVDLEILIDHQPDVLAVPLPSVIEKDEKEYAFIHTNDGWKPREIETGNDDGAFIEVKSGLHRGDTVILDATILPLNQ